MGRGTEVRLVDTMIFRYFDKVGLLGALLGLPQLAITSAVRRELRRWPDVLARVEAALASGQVVVADMDPYDSVGRTLYQLFRDRDGFGDGEATSMVVAKAHGFTFISHDLEAVRKIGRLGVNVLDWHDLLKEL